MRITRTTLRTHARSAGMVAAWTLMVLAAASWTWNARVEAGQAEERVRRRIHDLTAIQQSALPATSQQEALLRTDLNSAQQMLEGVKPRAAFDTAPRPRDRSDAFFELTEFVAEMTRHAAAAGVACREGEQFGFASHARSGPSTETLAFVHDQRVAAGEVLRALMAASPVRFEGLQRLRPPSAESHSGGLDDADFFSANLEVPRWPLEMDRVVVLRVTFSGRTEVLRNFLNQLAESGSPVMVRELKVESIPPPITVGSERPAIGGTLSLYSVTVEVIVGRAPPPVEEQDV